MRHSITRPLLIIGLSAILVAGCSVLPGRDKSDSTTDTASEDNPDGRKPVLAIEDNLLPDPRFVGTRIDIPPAFANASWSQPGGEPDHAMHHLSAPETLERAWRASIGKGAKRAPVTSPAVIAENKAFTMDPEGRISAVDTRSGDRIWQTIMTPDMREPGKKFWRIGGRVDPATHGFGGGLAYDSGWLYLVNGFAKAASLNATTGEVRWEVDLPAPVRNPPTASQGKLFVVTIDNQIMALDQSTGETLWVYQSFEESARILSSGSPAVDGDIVIAPFSSGEVVSLDSDSGRLLWTATIARSSRLNPLSILNDIAGSPVIDRGGVFAVSHAGQLAAIDGRTGRVAWEINASSRNTPWIAGDILYMVTTEGSLVAISRGDGSVVWRQQLPAYENPKKRKGAISWSGPVLAGGKLIMTSSSGRLIQINPQNGKTGMKHKLSGGTILPPVVADGTVFVLTDEGTLEAWR